MPDAVAHMDARGGEEKECDQPLHHPAPNPEHDTAPFHLVGLVAARFAAVQFRHAAATQQNLAGLAGWTDCVRRAAGHRRAAVLYPARAGLVGMQVSGMRRSTSSQGSLAPVAAPDAPVVAALAVLAARLALPAAVVAQLLYPVRPPAPPCAPCAQSTDMRQSPPRWAACVSMSRGVTVPQ